MEEDEVVPNLENWLVCLTAYSQQGKLDEAISIEVHARIWYFAKYCCVQHFDHWVWEGVQYRSGKAFISKFVGLGPDETTYRSIVEGFGRTDNYKEALWYYEKLKNVGFKPNSSNFYTMINLQARHRDNKGAIETLKDMRGMGCQYSSILTSLLQAYERVGRTCEVPLILKASFFENILLDPTSCSLLVMAYVQKSLLDEALQVMQENMWEDSDFEGNLYHLLICSCKKAGHVEKAVKIYTQMPKPEKNPSLHITCSMIDIYTAMNKFTDAESLHLMLKASEIPFDMVACSIVVRMYIKAESLKDACLVLDRMEKQRDIVPDAYLFRDML